MMNKVLPTIARALVWAILIVLFLSCLYILIAILRIQWAAGPHHISPAYGSMPESDYANFWAAGQLARHGDAAAIYSASAFQTFRLHLFGTAFAQLDWLYPPDFVLISEVFSLMPLLTGYFLWLALVFFLSVYVLRMAGLSWFVVLAGLAGPTTWRAYELGQIAPLAGALAFSGLLIGEKRPATAGIMLTLATLKPQLGILAPVALLSMGRWRVILFGAIACLSLAILTAIFCGLNIWSLFFHQAGAHGRAILEIMFPKGYPSSAASIFWMARAFHIPVSEAYLLQTTSALAAAICTWIFCRQIKQNDTRRAMVTCCLSLLVSPYLYASDLVAYSITLALLVEQRRKFSPLLAFMWIWPGISDPFTLVFGLPALPVFIVATVILIWWFGTEENHLTNALWSQA